MENEILRRAVAATKAGQTQEAYKLYIDILKLNPNNPEANHNLGVLSVGLGRTEHTLSVTKFSYINVNPAKQRRVIFSCTTSTY